MLLTVALICGCSTKEEQNNEQKVEGVEIEEDTDTYRFVDVLGNEYEAELLDIPPITLDLTRIEDQDGKKFYLDEDIASYEGVDRVDMVVTLHACDTATDYALAKAVAWGASVILSVPCCQHELNRQIHNEVLAPVFSYGVLKERIAALMTDGLRAQMLEQAGYDTQILEFIDMEHTPKNLLIRAVYTGKKKENKEQLRTCLDAFGLHPTLERLLKEGGREA